MVGIKISCGLPGLILVMLSLSSPAQEKDLSGSGRAFSLMFRDSIPMEVELVLDHTGLPDHYRCHVTTPVCDDGLCRPLILDVYWDLLGNFTGLEVPGSLPLTKWDHLEFTTEDYLKLEEILGDKNSLLGRVTDVNALFDPATKKISEKVDAVTGATLETVKNAVVPGAVYSSYTLWHIVNGEISNVIRQRTGSCTGPDLINKFLLSDHYPYHYEALDYLIRTGYKDHLPGLVRMLEKCQPFVARKAMGLFPGSWVGEERFQLAITQIMSHFNYRAQELWLNRLMEVRVHPGTLETLTRDNERFSQVQLQQVLELCDKNRSGLSHASIDRLALLLQHDHASVAEGTYRIFEKLAEQNKYARKILKDYERSQDT
jgi:hypothetical protein